MADRVYWVWLALKDEIALHDRVGLVNYLGGAEAVYDLEDYTGVINVSPELEKLLSDKSLEKAEEVCRTIDEIGGYIITPDDEEYPRNLKNIAVAPLALYCKGQHINWNESFALTVVGTRYCSDYGRKATDDIVASLAQYGIIIVSGMARGIDSVAARAALRVGGITAAVLGSGLDVIYPPEHSLLYEEISESGVVITEFPPGTPPLKQNFPQRNRIMAGLSLGLVVGQAPQKGGSLITANHAIEENRNVYVIPSDIYDEGFTGSNRLIKQGAKLITCAEDIIDDFPYLDLKKKEEDKIPVNLEGLNETEIEIVKALAERNAHIDELSRIVGISSGDLASILLMLEISGVVKKQGDNVYGINFSERI